MFLTLVVFVFVTVSVLFFDIIKPNNYPPGPTWYPILGNVVQICRLRKQFGMFCKAVAYLNKVYGKKGVIGLKIGKDKIVVANSYEAIKEMLTNESLDGRPTGPVYETRTWGTRKGIILTDEEFWQEQRKFVVKHLKEFGFAGRGMMEIIQNEAIKLMDDVNKIIDIQGGEKAIIDMQDFFAVNVLNTLWSMLAGLRYERTDVELKNVQKLFNELFQNVDMIGCLFRHFPFLRYIAPNFSGYTNFQKTHNMVYKFLDRELRKHVESFDENEPRDLMDVYLKVILEQEHEDNFSEKQLLAVCLDMFLAGSETTNKSLGFAFLHIISNGAIQQRMQKEIDDVIGRNRLPIWSDKSNLPYCDAVVHEALRFFMGNCFGVPHRALQSTKLCGFDIPKDTMVVGCFSGILMDEENFPMPELFNPDRFLKNNQLFVPTKFIPFGIGRRRCMGEVLGRQNLFLFITTLIQNFTFSLPQGCPAPDPKPNDGVTPGIKPFTAIVCRR